MEILKLEQRLEGAIGGRGKFLGYKPKNANGEEKKRCKIWTSTYEHQQKTRTNQDNFMLC